jgi:c-di-GMP-related signal transduction protein
VGCVVLAKKVETQEQHERIRDLGAYLFESNFFARPEVLHQIQVSTSYTVLLKFNNVLVGEPSLQDMRSKVKRKQNTGCTKDGKTSNEVFQLLIVWFIYY